MNIQLDQTGYILENLKLKDRIGELEHQARNSICQSCVSMTNDSQNQDCIIEDLTEKNEKLSAQLYRVERSLNRILSNPASPIKIENLEMSLKVALSLQGELLKENDYLRSSLESAKGDTKNLQKFLKGIGQTKVYNDCFNRQAI